jgi:hypothetical protein
MSDDASEYEEAFNAALEEERTMTIHIDDPELDPTDSPTRIFLLAEYWQREALKARAERDEWVTKCAELSMTRERCAASQAVREFGECSEPKP